MTAPKNDESARAGLCVTCLHSRRVESGRGSLFYLCQRSATDPAFPKYPPLPVIACAGHEVDAAQRAKRRIAAVVLDMDGLMLDTEPIYKAAWQQAARDCGYDLDDRSYLSLVGRPTDDCENRLLTQFGSGFPMERFHSRWCELWEMDVRQSGIPTKPGLMEFLSFLEARAVPVAIATSSDSSYTELSLRQAGLEGRFEVIVTRDRVVRGKPAPDVFLESARQLKVEPAECVVLEDSDAGILAASAAGMVPLMIPDIKPPSSEARAAAFRVLASLREAQELVELLISHGEPARP